MNRMTNNAGQNWSILGHDQQQQPPSGPAPFMHSLAAAWQDVSPHSPHSGNISTINDSTQNPFAVLLTTPLSVPNKHIAPSSTHASLPTTSLSMQEQARLLYMPPQTLQHSRDESVSVQKPVTVFLADNGANSRAANQASSKGLNNTGPASISTGPPSEEQSQLVPKKKAARARVVDLAPEFVHCCPFKDCSKKFAKKYNLKIHVRRHTGELPFMCEIPSCGKRFMWHSSFTRHLKSHERRPKLRRQKQPPKSQEHETSILPVDRDALGNAVPSAGNAPSVLSMPSALSTDLYGAPTLADYMGQATPFINENTQNQAFHQQVQTSTAGGPSKAVAAPFYNNQQAHLQSNIYSVHLASQTALDSSGRGRLPQQYSPVSDESMINMLSGLNHVAAQPPIQEVAPFSSAQPQDIVDNGNSGIGHTLGVGFFGTDSEIGNYDAPYSFLDSEQLG